ncbi:hypothetical protein [Candidatus Steffania adelgidicola]|uniref:hypothetical protein n=1 Tax=Candidatus Steffania adelgidicola TaxID=1076626 RepID=UPI001D0022D4|nr:hypothetical protein [Candidatus Steffania adelgidicola]UDG80112.1 hypothetical protein GFK82_00679 [Candidatus Steffania adelgidicola]
MNFPMYPDSISQVHRTDVVVLNSASLPSPLGGALHTPTCSQIYAVLTTDGYRCCFISIEGEKLRQRMLDNERYALAYYIYIQYLSGIECRYCILTRIWYWIKGI